MSGIKCVKELGIVFFCLRCDLDTSPRKHFRMPLYAFMRLDLDTDDAINESPQTQLFRS